MGKHFEKLIHLEEFESKMKSSTEKVKETITKYNQGFGETIFNIGFLSFLLIVAVALSMLSTSAPLITTIILGVVFVGILFLIGIAFLERKSIVKAEKLFDIYKKRTELALGRKLKHLEENIDDLYNEVVEGNMAASDQSEHLVEVVLIRKRNKIRKETNIPEEKELSKNEKLLKEVEMLEERKLHVETY